MHNELYIKAYERLKSLDRVHDGKIGVILRKPVYRRMITLSAVSVLFTCVVMSLFDHFGRERGGKERSGSAAPLEIARLDESRHPVGIDHSHDAVEVHALQQPAPTTPDRLTVVKIYPPVGGGTKTAVAVKKQGESPVPDLASASAPHPNPLNKDRTEVALAPPMQPRAKVVDTDPPPESEAKPEVVSTKPVEAPTPDVASASSAERGATEEHRADLPSARLIDAPHVAIPDAASSTTSADGNAVIAALGKYSNAWNTRRVAEITALRPGLPRRAVEQELSSARSITMRIQPTSVPRIQGNRATVECIHQVDQVFRDGVKKQNPGVKMTYVLVKRGSDWLIEESR